MKKLTSVILVLCLAFSVLTLCAAKSPVKYGNAHIEMLNYGEFPAEEASVEIPRLNSAEGAEDFINGTAVDSFNSIYHVYGSTSSYYPGYYGGLTAAGTTLYYSSPSDIRFYDTVTKETGTLGIDSEVSISSCRYDGNGILSVFFSKKPNNYDDSGSREVTLFNAGDPDGDGIVTSSDLVSVQKYLLTGSLDLNWAVYDVTGNIGIDILDFIRIKKLSAR